MSDARRYAVWPEPRSRSRSLKRSRPSVPHGTNFYCSIFTTVMSAFRILSVLSWYCSECDTLFDNPSSSKSCSLTKSPSDLDCKNRMFTTCVRLMPRSMKCQLSFVWPNALNIVIFHAYNCITVFTNKCISYSSYLYIAGDISLGMRKESSKKS